MTKKLEMIRIETLKEANNNNYDDYLTIGHLYFTCGWSENTYFNEQYVTAIALIGLCYTNKVKGKSNYSRGIKYIADDLGISRTQVKSLRKKMEASDGYAFKTPISTARIIERIIALLLAACENEVVKEYLRINKNKMFRTVLLHNQNEAIQIAANKPGAHRVRKVANELNRITMKVGD